MGRYKETGVHRFECRDCGVKWSVAAEQFRLLGYPECRHAHHCNGTDGRRMAHIESMKRYYPEKVFTLETIHWHNTIEAEKVIRSRSIRHIKSNHPTECGDRCRGAKGADCDCKCGGEFHGIDS